MTRRRSRSARRNPAPLYSRVTVRDVLVAWPALGPSFARALAVAALEDGGFSDDPATTRALKSKTRAPLSRVLRRCGTPLCVAAADAGDGTTDG